MQSKAFYKTVSNHMFLMLINVREYKIKNEQSRETGNIGYTRRRKSNKHTTQYMLNTTMRKQKQLT